MAFNSKTGAIKKDLSTRTNVLKQKENSPVGKVNRRSLFTQKETTPVEENIRKNVRTQKDKPSTSKFKRTSVRIPKEQFSLNGVAIPTYSEQEPEDDNQNQKYTIPKLHSVLKMKQELENIESVQAPTLDEEITNVILPKVTQKLNFEPNRPVFKNLVSVNINDSLLPKKATSIRKKYDIKSKKIPAPDLSDFLDPLPPLTLVVPLPEITLEFPEYKYDVLAAYKRFVNNL